MNPYYQDDSVTLYHGDCLEITEWLDADVLVTDPPYGMSYKSGSAIACSRREAAGEIVRRVKSDDSTVARDKALALWGSGPALMFGTWRVERPSGTRQVLVWDKKCGPGMGSMYLPWGSSHEEIYVLGRNADGDQFGWSTATRASSVITCSYIVPGDRERPHGQLNHPTPEPVSLLERLIDVCPPGVIADPFAGGGGNPRGR